MDKEKIIERAFETPEWVKTFDDLKTFCKHINMRLMQKEVGFSLAFAKLNEIDPQTANNVYQEINRQQAFIENIIQEENQKNKDILDIYKKNI